MTKARDISDLLDTNGQVDNADIANVDASKVSTGTLDTARVPNLDTSKITSGTFADARMPSTVLNSNVDLTNLSASNLTSGTVPIARLGASGTKNSTTFLRGDNTFAEAGGGLVKLAETNVSSSVSTVSFDGYFTSDYNIYKVFVQNLRPVSGGNTTLCMRLRRSNADVTSSAYYGAVQQAFNGGANHNGDFPSSLINIVKDSSVKGSSDYGWSGEVTFYNPLQTTRYHMIAGYGTYLYSTTRWYTHQFGGVLKDNTSAISGFTFLNSVGENFDDGNFYLFGMKTS